MSAPVLREPGWARQPLLAFEPRRCGGPFVRRLRLKQWDYYGLWAPGVFAGATLANVGYLGLASVYVVDLATGRNPEHTIVRPLGRGIALPRESTRGDVAFAGGGLRIELCVRPGERTVRVVDGRFDDEAGLEIEAVLDAPPHHESVVTATPFADGGFYYDRKIQCLPARGFVQWGARRVELDPASSSGQLDWGRGVWPRHSHWVWASASGCLPDGRRAGLNLGYFGDHAAAAENALVLGGRIHKIGAVEARFDRSDYRAPWRFTDRDGRLEVTLHPRVERVASTDMRLLRSEVHQCFGTFTGRVVADDGEKLALQDLPGFAEEQVARW